MQTKLKNENSPGCAGWKVVAAAFLEVMVGFAGMVPFTFSLFLDPLHAAFGWKREAISRAFGIAALTVAFVSPLIGSLLDRLPPRRIILPCIAVFAAAMASLQLLHGTLPQYYATYLVLGIVGNGTAQLAYSTAGCHDPVTPRHGDWPNAYRRWRRLLHPADVGPARHSREWLASGLHRARSDRAGRTSMAALFVFNRPAYEPQQATAAEGFPRATRTGSHRAFWLIALPTLMVALSTNALIAHLSALLTSRGVSTSSAAITLSVYGASAIVGCLLTGFLLDRVSAPVVSCAVLAIACAGVFVEAYANTPAAGTVALLGAVNPKTLATTAEPAI